MHNITTASHIDWASVSSVHDIICILLMSLPALWYTVLISLCESAQTDVTTKNYIVIILQQDWLQTVERRHHQARLEATRLGDTRGKASASAWAPRHGSSTSWRSTSGSLRRWHVIAAEVLRRCSPCTEFCRTRTFKRRRSSTCKDFITTAATCSHCVTGTTCNKSRLNFWQYSSLRRFGLQLTIANRSNFVQSPTTSFLILSKTLVQSAKMNRHVY